FRGLSELSGGIGLIHELIAGSLGGTLDDAQAQVFLDLLVRGPGQANLVNALRGALGIAPSAVRDCWRTPRGLLQARRFVFQQTTFSEHQRLPLMVIALEVARQQKMFGEKM